MLRDEPTIRGKIYELPDDPLVEEILVPAMRQSVEVRGAFGWFSAGWIPFLAPGLAAFLENPAAKKIKMVVSPALYPDELEALTSAEQSRDLAVERFMSILDEAGGMDGDILAKHAVDCLAWMYASGRLEIRIAVPHPWSNYHPKVWEFTDAIGDRVGVLGSANATNRAFFAAEHMTAECSWDRQLHVDDIEKILNNYWSGDSSAIQQTVPLSAAVEQQLLSLAPEEAPGLDQVLKDWKKARTTEKYEGNDQPAVPVFSIPPGLNWMEGAYAHQGEAVKAWEQAGRRGILEMATGAGKTKTAMICAYRTSQVHQGSLLVVVTAPSNPLIAQWKAECIEFGLSPLVLSELTPAKRKSAVPHMFDRLRSRRDGHVEVVIASNDFIKSPAFQNAISEEILTSPMLGLMHIGDEAHGLGTELFLRNLPDFFTYRLGLSATPDRQYDDEGTKELKEYFGNVVFEFGLGRAIGLCLSPYQYFFSVVHLDEDELDQYRKLSRAIALAHSDGDQDKANRLMIKRRGIVENAGGKLAALQSIVQNRKPKHLLVYCSAKNPKQLELAMKCLERNRIDAARVTETESGNRRRLAEILDAFGEGDIHALVAKKVLDEGVDIPATSEAILLASSTVAREWIQRRGRVLRMAPGKERALIHDVMALPPPSSDFESSTFGIVKQECARVREFARYAENVEEVMADVEVLLSGYKR